MAAKAAGDIDPLLLAAGEGGRRQVPEGSRDGSRSSSPPARACAPRATSPRAISGSATMSSVGTRGMARRNWLTEPMVWRRTSR